MKFNSGIFNDDLLRTDLSMDQMFYAQLFAIRRFEETLLKLFSENQLGLFISLKKQPNS